MANAKLFIEETLYREHRQELPALLEKLKRDLCETLSVAPEACQFAAVAVIGIPDQPKANLEFQFLMKPERNKAILENCCIKLRDEVSKALNILASVRAVPLDPETYFALKA